MIHERLDLGRFERVFPLATLREEARAFVLAAQAKSPARYADAKAVEDHIRLMEPKAGNVTGPREMVVIEQLRREALGGEAAPEGVPTDVCVFARGEPADRRGTKIGGVPFWPARKRWPRKMWGKPLQFVAQFNFGDSRDICGRVPGDLLLIFGEREGPGFQSMKCFWVDSAAERPLSPGEVPEFEEPLVPLHAQLHRTRDFAGEVAAFRRVPKGAGLERVEGTKMGGVPAWVQREEAPAGRFLCVLGSILPETKSPWPWVNVEGAMGFREAHDEGLLMWGDVGSVYFFVGEDGRVGWVEQGY